MNNYTFKPINMVATGNNIKERRKLLKITLEELSEVCCVSQQAVCKWQRGEALPNIDNLMVLCDLFDTHVEDLIVREDDRSSAVYGEDAERAA